MPKVTNVSPQSLVAVGVASMIEVRLGYPELTVEHVRVAIEFATLSEKRLASARSYDAPMGIGVCPSKTASSTAALPASSTSSRPASTVGPVANPGRNGLRSMSYLITGVARYT